MKNVHKIKIKLENIWIDLIMGIYAPYSCNFYGTGITFTAPQKLAAEGRFATLTHVVSAGFSMTAATQLLVTTLIAWKIWWSSRGLSRRYMGIVWMLVESGTLAYLIK